MKDSETCTMPKTPSRQTPEERPSLPDCCVSENDMSLACPSGCSGKTKVRSEAELRSLLNRLSRIEGQVHGIRGMVEKNAYCTDILIQVSAVTAALNAFNRELLSNHIRSCVSDGLRSGHDEVVDELIATLQKLMK